MKTAKFAAWRRPIFWVAATLLLLTVVALTVQGVLTVPDATGTYAEAAVSMDENGLIAFTIDLNTADKIDLMRLPEMTLTLAQAVLDYRDYYGSFSDVREIGNVKGVTAEMRDLWVPYLTVGRNNTSV